MCRNATNRIVTESGRLPGASAGTQDAPTPRCAADSPQEPRFRQHTAWTLEGPPMTKRACTAHFNFFGIFFPRRCPIGLKFLGYLQRVVRHPIMPAGTQNTPGHYTSFGGASLTVDHSVDIVRAAPNSSGPQIQEPISNWWAGCEALVGATEAGYAGGAGATGRVRPWRLCPLRRTAVSLTSPAHTSG